MSRIDTIAILLTILFSVLTVFSGLSIGSGIEILFHHCIANTFAQYQRPLRFSQHSTASKCCSGEASHSVCLCCSRGSAATPPLRSDVVPSYGQMVNVDMWTMDFRLLADRWVASLKVCSSSVAVSIKTNCWLLTETIIWTTEHENPAIRILGLCPMLKPMLR